MKKFFVSLAIGGLISSQAWSKDQYAERAFTKGSVGLYSLLADDGDITYKTNTNWQPSLHPYQQKGFNTLYLTFIRPDTLEVPASFINLTRTRGQGTPGAVPADTKIIFAIGGIAYSESINPWPWLTSAEAARNAARRVVQWKQIYGADGIDLDIEEGAGNASAAGQNLIEFVRELKRIDPQFLVTLPVYGYPQIDAANKLVNAAFGPNGEDFNLLDSVGIMVYEDTQALNYIGNYAKLPGVGRWDGFPISADVPKKKIFLGIKGSASNGTISAMSAAIDAQGLGGMMAWYGSLLNQGQGALQYARDWDSSPIGTQQWQTSRFDLEN
jgi:hypothetical protein